MSNYFRLVENNMIKIITLSDFVYPTDEGGGLDIANIMNPMESMFTVNNWDSFERLLLSLKQTAFKWSNSALNIKGMDALLNGDIDKRVKKSVHQKWFMPCALIVARLANNPDFEDLVVSLGQFGVGGRSWPAGTKTIPSIAWPKLVKYLREEVKPLV
jgi:hypothetical protein